MYHSPFVQPPLTNVGSSLERLLGIFQDRGVICRQPRSQGLSLNTWIGKSFGNKDDFQAVFITKNGGHVKFPTLGTDLTVKAPWLARSNRRIPGHYCFGVAASFEFNDRDRSRSRKTMTRVGLTREFPPWSEFLCPCVGPFPSVGLTLTWFIWDRNVALHITLYSVNSV